MLQLSYFKSELQISSTFLQGASVALTINTPTCPTLSIQVLIPERGRITGTCLDARTAVDTDLQAHIVDLSRSPRDTVRELDSIGLQAVCHIVAILVSPTVIDVHVLVACGLAVLLEGLVSVKIAYIPSSLYPRSIVQH